MILCSPEYIAKLEQRLLDIDDERMKLATGARVVSLQADGEQVGYAQAEAEREKFLNNLEGRTRMQLARCQNRPSGYGRMRKAY